MTTSDRMYADIVQSAIWKAGSAEDFREVTTAVGEPILTTMLPGEPDLSVQPDVKGISAYQLWQIQKARADLRKEYLDYWNQTIEATGTGRPVDAIISPGAPFAAPPHGKNK